MKLKTFFIACAFLSIANIAIAYNFKTDLELGTSFKTCEIKTNGFKATLIHKIPQNTQYKAAILYVHGFNDYFFQAELANRADSLGYKFFAIDLHANGRSFINGEQRGKLRDIQEYYAELDSAIAIIKDVSGLPVVLLGHSTGGLITTLYAIDRQNSKSFDAMVLNSPFFEMNFNPLLVKIFKPVLSKLGKYAPDFKIPTAKNTFYGESLYKGAKGEWAFDTTKKSFLSPTEDLGWVRAISLGQFRMQKRRHLKLPILIMRSSCSIINATEWVDEFTYCDAVLNVEDIEKYGKTLGENVTEKVIEGGIHDLYLSKTLVRENAYKETFEFLDNIFEAK